MSHVEVIAELGSSHDGSVGTAHALMRVAADAGCDSAKFQNHKCQHIDPNATHPYWFQGSREVESRQRYVERISAWSDQDWRFLRNEARAMGLRFIVSPFSLQALEHCALLEVDGIKVASGQLGNTAMLEALRDFDIDVYLSSGMTSWSETHTALRLITPESVPLHAVMHCSSEYPTQAQNVGLSALRLGQPGGIYRAFASDDFHHAGLSDHSDPTTNAAALGAVALGATIIERHVCLSRHGYGSDIVHAQEPHELRQLVREVRALEKMLGAYPGKDAMVEKLADVRKQFLETA